MIREVKKFIGGLVIFAIFGGLGCRILAAFGAMTAGSSLFLWIAIVTVYCFGYGMHAIDSAPCWHGRPTDEDVHRAVEEGGRG